MEHNTGSSGSAAASRDWRRIFRIIGTIALVIVGVPSLVFVALVIYRIPHVANEKRSAETVRWIHAQKLTMADVDGSNLPPVPDPKIADATLEGVDANRNGIRDDVELAIFAKYPTSTAIRAGELQYAKATQLEFTSVFSTSTLVAVIQEEGRGDMCSGLAIHNLRDSIYATKEIVNFVFNTETRKRFREDLYGKYMVSHGDSGIEGKPNCDIEIIT